VLREAALLAHRALVVEAEQVDAGPVAEVDRHRLIADVSAHAADQDDLDRWVVDRRTVLPQEVDEAGLRIAEPRAVARLDLRRVHDRRAEAGALDRACQELDASAGRRARAARLRRRLTLRRSGEEGALLRVVERAQQQRGLGRDVALRLRDNRATLRQRDEDLARGCVAEGHGSGVAHLPGG
jgi:hypothetical protein